MEQNQFKEIVFIVDANYLDKVAGEVREFLREEAGFAVELADMPAWMINNVMGVIWEAEDAKRPDYSKQQVQVIMVCEKGQKTMKHFNPSDLTKVDGMAFRDNQFGEYLMSVVEDEHLVEGDPLIVQSVEVLANSNIVKHLLVVADPMKGLPEIQRLAKDSDKHVEVFNLRSSNENKQFSMLSISLLASFGITPEQLAEAVQKRKK